MSLTDALEQHARRHTQPNASHVVTLDIERFPGAFRIDNWRGLTVEGEFWDLSQYRRTIGRRIMPDEVTRWPRTITVQWRWYGTKKIHYLSEWGDGYEAMLKAAWDVYDRADLVQGHNVDVFDSRKLTGEWAMLGLTEPSPWRAYDTLKVARRYLGMESNTLDSLCDRFGLARKQGKYSIETARLALAGDKKAQAEIKSYACGDVPASEGLADFLRPFHKSHPHLTLPGDDRVCNRCGSTDLTLMPKRWRANVQDYALLKCNNCGGHVRAGYVARVAQTRGV